MVHVSFKRRQCNTKFAYILNTFKQHFSFVLCVDWFPFNSVQCIFFLLASSPFGFRIEIAIHLFIECTIHNNEEWFR